MNCGSTNASIGTMIPTTITASSAVRPRNCRCASANAIIEHTSTVRITDSVEMIRLLRYHQPIGLAASVEV
jgi:hypothetical protein